MTETEVIETPAERTRVGFPEAPAEKPKSNKALIAVIVLLLLLLGVGGWFMFGRQGNLSLIAEVTPTPTEAIEITNTPIPTEAEEELIREGVTIQVLNGTGIPGAAGDLQSELEDLGYEDVDTGNSSTQNATTTTVVFDPDVSTAVREDIMTLLNSFYSQVSQSEKANSEFDVVITTGNPKGGRPATPSVRATTTPTRAGTTTPTKTPTPTP